jgi:hypothetical protein
MSKYKFHKLKELNKLPDDVNVEFEALAINKYKSKNLKAGLIAIKKGRKYTKKNPGAMLINTKTFKILCYVEAHDGVVKDMTINEFVVSSDKANDIKKMWNDNETEFIIPNSMRNNRIDWEVPKKEKPCRVKEKVEKKAEKKENNNEKK